MTEPQNQPIGFHFINLAHPHDATKPSSLSRIRSHAAKDIRARVRRSRQATALPEERSKHRVRRRSQVASAVPGKVENSAELSCTPEQQGTERIDPVHSQSTSPRVLQIPSFPRRDPHWSPARPLSAQELFLLDHYINYVILFRNGSCHKVGGSANCHSVSGNAKAWFTSMQLRCWFPFALADPGLLAALLLHSCRSLEMLSGSQTYAGIYTAYKHQCIRSANRSLSFEDTRISDATIAIVMVLLSESYILGNLEEWQVHLDACTNMIAMRGGIDALGLDGFLKEVIVKLQARLGLPGCENPHNDLQYLRGDNEHDRPPNNNLRGQWFGRRWYAYL